MPALINWNVVSSRLRRYLFNNRTESNWLCKEKSASMQASESRLILLSEWYTELFGSRQKHNAALPSHIFVPLQTPRARPRPHAASPWQRAELLSGSGSVPSVSPTAAVLFCFCRMPPSVLTVCCSAALQPATLVKPSSVFLALQNLNYPYK